MTPDTIEPGADERSDALGAEGVALDEAGALGAVRREAAGYRRRLREAEAERDSLREQVHGLQRHEVERVATTAATGFRPLVDATDLWRNPGVSLDRLVTENGRVDPEMVRAAVQIVGAEHPHWLAPAAWGDCDAGKGTAWPSSAADGLAGALQSAGGA